MSDVGEGLRGLLGPSKRPALVGWLALLGGVGLLIIGFVSVKGFQPKQFFQDMFANTAFTLLSIAGTVLIVDRMNQAKAAESVLHGLLRDISSPHSTIAVRSARELKTLGKITDGFLDNRDLSGADLTKASLECVRAEGSRLIGCVFTDSDMSKANLRGAKLNHSVLRGTNLEGAVLEGCTMVEVDLSGASMSGANLMDVNLSSAVVAGTDFRNVDLRNALLIDVDLTTAYLEGARLGGAIVALGSPLGSLPVPTENAGVGRLRWADGTTVA